MSAIQRFLKAGEKYLELAYREELASKHWDKLSGELFEQEVAKLLSLQNQRFKERNKLIADADEVARLCQQAGQDARLVYVVTEAANQGGGPSEVRKHWQALQAMLRVVALNDDDPWVTVLLRDMNVDRSKVSKDANDPNCDWIERHGRGVYRVRKSHLHEYLTVAMVKQYLAD